MIFNKNNEKRANIIFFNFGARTLQTPPSPSCPVLSVFPTPPPSRGSAGCPLWMPPLLFNNQTIRQTQYTKVTLLIVWCISTYTPYPDFFLFSTRIPLPRSPFRRGSWPASSYPVLRNFSSKNPPVPEAHPYPIRQGSAPLRVWLGVVL